MSESVKQLQQKGVRWNTITSVVVLLIQIITSFWLNKIISQDDFGVLIWSYVIIQILLFFSNYSWHEVLVRDKEFSQKKYSTAFIIGLITNGLLFVVCFFGAELIASFSDKINSPKYIRIFSFFFIISALVLVPMANMTKKIEFKRLSQFNLIARIISSILVIYFALQEQFFLSLVIFKVGTLSIYYLLIIARERWIPKLHFDRNYVKKNLSIASSLTLMKFANIFGEKADTLLIGTEYNKDDVTSYDKPYGVQTMPITALSGSISKVTLPSLAQVQDDNEAFQDIFFSTQNLLAFLIFPIFGLIFFVAKPFSIAYFDEDWNITLIVKLMRIFAISGLFVCFFSLFNSVLSIKAKPKEINIITLSQRGLFFVLLLLVFQIGLVWIAVAKLIASIVGFIIYGYFINKHFNINYFTSLLDLGRTVFVTILAGIPVYFLSKELSFSPLLTFFVCSIIYGILYLFFAFLFDRKGLEIVKEHYWKR